MHTINAFQEGYPIRLLGIHDLTKIFGESFHISRVYSYLQDLRRLPYKKHIVRFVDFDDTLVSREPELSIDDGLRSHRGERVYAYIAERGGFDWYIETFHRGGQARFVNVHEVLYGERCSIPVILTAGNKILQIQKILANGFGNIPRIVVPKAEMKILSILRFIQYLGYIPLGIEFIDDRIENFVGIDRALETLFGVPVRFEKAIPNGSRVHRALISR